MYYRYRMYDTGIGRFVSRDPIGYRGSPDGNLYVYARDNPAMYKDPMGLDVNLWPKNGAIENKSTKATATVEGDYLEVTITITGRLPENSYPKSEFTLAGLRSLIQQLQTDGQLDSSRETNVSAQANVGPGGKLPIDDNNAGIANIRFLDGVSTTLYDSDCCCKKYKTSDRVKIAAGTITISDCKKGDLTGVYYELDTAARWTGGRQEPRPNR